MELIDISGHHVLVTAIIVVIISHSLQSGIISKFLHPWINKIMNSVSLLNENIFLFRIAMLRFYSS